MDIKEERKRVLFGKMFAKYLSEWMESNGKTQNDFCVLAGVSKNIVTAWKHGERYPHGSTLDRICDVFQISPLVFDPAHMLPFERDRFDNSITEARSMQLQRYAKEKGLDDGWYQSLISDPMFLCSFPFHKKDWFWNNPMNNYMKNKGVVQFELVKYQFEDSKGQRIMMSEEDIDYLVILQKYSREICFNSMRKERARIEENQVKTWVRGFTEHLDILPEDVLKRLYEVDFSKERERITERSVRDTVLQMAKEKGIKPHYTKEDIIGWFPEDDPGYIKMMHDWNRIHGASEEEIKQLETDLQKERKQAIDAMIEQYRKLGLLISDDNTGSEDATGNSQNAGIEKERGKSTVRNMEKTARKTHEVKNQTRLDGYDLTFAEYKRLEEMILNGKCPEAVSMAFNYGFALGHRATVAGKVTKKI